ncbi:MAG: hypothetical protein JSV19_13180 [Phycisphaerales bacterium]|nr:MAG: hypothetical protein JSV19_13180 [Phycisphaerales bacterium]
MRILPIGLQTSRLLLAQWSLLYTPRVLQWGIAQSLLVARLRHRAGYLFGPVLSPGPCRLPTVLPYAVLPPADVDEIEPLDLVWPSERDVDDAEVIIVVESPTPVLVPLPGSIIDLLS